MGLIEKNKIALIISSHEIVLEIKTKERE